MDALLTPLDLSAAEATARCERALRQRTPGWYALARCLAADERAGVLSLRAWSAALHAAAPHELAAVGTELEAAIAGRPTSALGIALARTIERYELPVNLLRGQIQARRRDGSQSVFETREELIDHVRKLATPDGRLLLRVFDKVSERNEVLADSLCIGLQLAVWTSSLGPELERGQLRLPMTELRRCGAALPRPDERTTPELRRAVAAQIAWARGYLMMGWPLCLALGPWRGRVLAFVLRWHAAALSALEAKDHDVMHARTSGRVLRLAACLSVSAATRHAPRFE